ncbi:2-oxoglutarate dehydrogenase E1 subunit family protein [Nocardia terpenica]|uniref:2-oxoglutarate dehydrogenase E1 subunit family protein n=1 Tax=Nocardia terpenica TaxID=455432 RepID=UPI0009ED4CD3
MRRTPAVSSSTSQFGQNQWLVDEMYQKYKQDPSSVDESWHEFLADYTPETPGDTGNSTAAPTVSAAPATTAPAPAPTAPTRADRPRN